MFVRVQSASFFTTRAIFASIAVVLTLSKLPIVDVRADGPADNIPTQVRPVPPPGIELPESVKTELLAKVKAVREALDKLDLNTNSRSQIEVIPRAVELAVEQGMFYTDKEFGFASELLELAQQRVRSAAEGKRDAELLELTIAKRANAKRTGETPDGPRLHAGGFRSQIDGSIQPYGIVLPSGWMADPSKPLRLDVWLHGRGEKVSEVAFLHQRMLQVGEFTPPNTLVLHPYGRYCNAFKFAGEMDVLEAIEHVKQLYPIDDARIVIRGFSMGGAGCWQMAVHYPQLWAAANPGAGFSETTEFLRIFQKEQFKPTDYQRQLLHWYDCPDWTNNLRNVPTVAYSGEVDNQKQAADVMEAAFKVRGMKLPHIIGAQTAHKILAESKPLIQEQLDAALDAGRKTIPKAIELTTYMLRYHQLAWLSVEGLEKHWQEAVVHAELGDRRVLIQSKNVSRIKLQFSNAEFPFAADRAINLKVDAQRLSATFNDADNQKTLWLVKDSRGLWQTSSDASIPSGTLVKQPGLTGPIDDAFMEPFIWVPPTETNTLDWIDAEYKHATMEWRRHFRGDIVAKSELTDEDIANNNLVLFGTPSNNPWIAKIVSSLPIEWNEKQLKVNGKEYDATKFVPLLIYPNPLNPKRYVVINSGFTFREYAYLNNARQIPMLPDWAVIDATTETNAVTPGTVVDAGFFDESWRF